jgi:hypothetical protein
MTETGAYIIIALDLILLAELAVGWLLVARTFRRLDARLDRLDARLGTRIDTLGDRIGALTDRIDALTGAARTLAELFNVDRVTL